MNKTEMWQEIHSDKIKDILNNLIAMVIAGKEQDPLSGYNWDNLNLAYDRIIEYIKNEKEMLINDFISYVETTDTFTIEVTDLLSSMEEQFLQGEL